MAFIQYNFKQGEQRLKQRNEKLFALWTDKVHTLINAYVASAPVTSPAKLEISGREFLMPFITQFVQIRADDMENFARVFGHHHPHYHISVQPDHMRACSCILPSQACWRKFLVTWDS